MMKNFEHTFQQAITQYYLELDVPSAKSTCEQIIKENPRHIDAMYLLGLCFCYMGNTEIGLRHIEEAVSLKPELEAYDFRCNRMVQQGDTSITEILDIRFHLYLKYQTIDAFLISFPKCGRTWLRLLLGKYVIGKESKKDPIEVFNLTCHDPEFNTLEVTHDDDPHMIPPDELFADKRAYAGKKVIFLVRDPRDVLVSNYFQHTKRKGRQWANDDFEGDLSSFIRHNIGGIENLVGFYNIWAENRDVPEKFLLVTYEDMHKDTRKVFTDCLDFLGWPKRSYNFIDEVVNYGHFDNMLKLEKTNSLNNIRLGAPPDSDPEAFKVRKGKVGGYIDYMSEDDISYVNDYLAANLHDYYGIYK